jgi:hypothetical protein
MQKHRFHVWTIRNRGAQAPRLPFAQLERGLPLHDIPIPTYPTSIYGNFP